MFRKNYFTILFTIALLSLGSVVISAQTAPVSGKVSLKKADGETPVQGAMVEVFRTDIKGKGPTAKTNKKGEFSFAGLQLGATYVLSISAPGAKPGYFPNLKAGNDKIVITLEEGDGKRWTEEEIRSAVAGASTNVTATAPTGELTAEQKKAQEERAKLEAEYNAKKQKTEADNAVIDNALKAGNQAFEAKNYDTAIAEYDKGIQANPTYLGSAPTFFNNKGLSLSNRGVDTFNQAIKMTDASAKAAANAKVTKDFSDAIDAYNSSWTLLKNAPAAEITNQQNFAANKLQALSGIRTTVNYMIRTEKVDSAKAALISTLLAEYLATETDAAKKTEAEVFLGDIYRISGDSTNAIAEYKKVIEKSPNNPDALAGLGLSQANAGYNADGSINEAMMQEAINNLQKFADTAPANHKLKDSVKQTVDYLKTQNFKPQKSSGGKKKS